MLKFTSTKKPPSQLIALCSSLVWSLTIIFIILAFRKCPMFEQAYETHSTDPLFTSIGENNSSWPGNFFGTKNIWVPVLSHFWDQTYLSPCPIPLLGPKLFESQSRPVFRTKLIWVPVPSRFRDQIYLSPSPIPLTGPERAESRSWSRTTKAGPAELWQVV